MFDNYTKQISFFHKLFLLLVILLIHQCSNYRYSSSSYEKMNAKSIQKDDLLNAQFYFYRNSDTSIVLYNLIHTDPLLYSRLDTGLQFYATIKISVHLYSTTKHIFTDSISQNFYLPQSQNKFFGRISMHCISDDYSVKISIMDMNRKKQYMYYTDLRVSNDNERNNFLITNKDSLLFKPFALERSVLKIYHRKKYPFIYVNVFKHSPDPAPPPFSNVTTSINYLPDSSFVLNLVDGNFYELQLAPSRYYHIRVSQNLLSGLSIFSVDSVFPNIKNTKEMIYATRYIMNRIEYEKCLSGDTKKCIDNFWIQIGGSKERAKELIKRYYQRVIETNQLFTNYKYGWQTDRGMIYIVFGPPEDVEKSNHTEKWYYSMNGQKNALMFKFTKNKHNPFTTSDFVLERNEYYKDIWYITVDKIRQGIMSGR